MVLLHPQRVAVALGQIPLQIALNVVGRAEGLAKLDHPVRVALPICGLGDRQVVGTADLVQIDKLMRLAHDLKARITIEGGLQADPCKDASVMKLLESRDSIARQRCDPLPLEGESIVQAREAGGK